LAMREMGVILLCTNDSFLSPSSLLPLSACVCVCVSLSLSLYQCLNNKRLKASHPSQSTHKLYLDYY
jgi:hypothetical protein